MRSSWIAYGVIASGCGRLQFDARVDAGPGSFSIYAAVQVGTLSALQFDGAAIAELPPRIDLGGPIDAIAVDPSRTYMLAAGGSLTCFGFDASGALVHESSDGGGQYSTTQRMRLAFHPTLPWFYMSGDGPLTTNVLEYQLQAGTIVAQVDVGTEATPIGIAVNASGTMAYTTSGIQPSQVCAHPINADGSLGAMAGCIATCAPPVELFALADRVVVVCSDSTMSAHVLDASLLPTAAQSFAFNTTVRGAHLSRSAIVYAATAADEVARVDPATLTAVGSIPVRAGTLAIATSPDERLLFGGDPAGVAVYDGGVQIAATPADVGGTPISIVVR